MRVLPALVTALLLAGCSSSASEPSSGTDSGGGGRAGADAQFPVSIDHAYGTTTVTERPERVVSVGLSEQDALLALGVVPVATTTWIPVREREGNIFPWADDALGDAQPPVALGSDQEFEQVAALEPDLIVGMYSAISARDCELWSAIAPTIAKPEGVVDYGVSWQQVVQTLREALGEQEPADELVTGIDAAFAAALDGDPSTPTG